MNSSPCFKPSTWRTAEIPDSDRLALFGGPPTRIRALPYGRQSIDGADIQAVISVLESDWLTTGPVVDRFERQLAEIAGAEHAVAVSSGTAALHAAAFVAGLGPGDEAIVPALTFAASANCVRYLGADVVFADVRPDTLNLDPQQVEGHITARTKAIVTVDFAGQPSDLDEIKDVAAKHDLSVIEDASHALGARYRGGRVGSLVPFTTFSFHPVKHVTTGEGGAITTDNAVAAQRLRLFRNHGISSDHRGRDAANTWSYDMDFLGFNYRITDLQCALGESQLRRLPAWVERRRDIACRYDTALAQFPEIELPAHLPDREPAWHLYVVKLALDRLRADRGTIFKALRAENIGVNVHYIPVPWHPYYQGLGYRKGNWPVAESAYERLLTLPLFPTMSDDDVDDVVRAVAKVLRHFRA